jgi:tight adherence protein B
MTLTATERLTGNIMAALPVLVGVGFMVMQPEMGRLLYETTIGRIAIVVAIILEIIGIIMIRKLANIKI